MSPLRVGLIGLGTVGGGVAKILLDHREQMVRRAGRALELRRVAVRDRNKPRDVNIPADRLTDDALALARDPDVDVVVELIGGLSPAREIVETALQAGKDVVTANKALLCESGRELFAKAREQRRCIAFEAAVAGGIPIVHVLGQAMTANQITSIEAILNGTSNFILTEMLGQGESYEDALRQAQEQGYAEADPAMDVDGTDAAQKLCLLVQLAFGTRVTPEMFLRQGVDTLELADLKYADELGYTVKLLATAKLVSPESGVRSQPESPRAAPRGSLLEMHTQPTLIRHNRPLAQVDGAYNMLALTGNHIGPTWYSGPGAGALPTASAVVSDLIDVAVGRAQLTFSRLDLWDDGKRGQTPYTSNTSEDERSRKGSDPVSDGGGVPIQPADEITRRYYLRFNVEDKPHVIADIADVLGRHGISLASVIQHEAPEVDEASDETAPIVPLVIMTHRTREGSLRSAGSELDALDCLRPPWVCMPVSD